nr:hypothetical protein C47C12.5 - Caenorhabditis elegans [Caenorhabditis elegans]
MDEHSDIGNSLQFSRISLKNEN